MTGNKTMTNFMLSILDWLTSSQLFLIPNALLAILLLIGLALVYYCFKWVMTWGSMKW